MQQHAHHFHKKNHKEHSNLSLVKFATFFSVSCVSIILVAKIIGWFFTSSLSMAATLADSLLDAVTSCINFFAVRYAAMPPDNEHRYGHNKAEDLALFVQAAFFAVSGSFLLFMSIKGLFSPVHIQHEVNAMYMIAISIVVTLVLVIVQHHVIEKTHSHIVKADFVHYVSDLFSNLATLASLFIVSKFHWYWVDAVFAILIAVYILYNSVTLLKRAFKNLLDHEFDPAEKEAIFELVKDFEEVRGIHDLKTRYAGSKPFIQFHLELDPKMTLEVAHKIAEDIEEKLMEKFEGAEVIIHQDPEGIQEPRYWTGEGKNK